jgi:flagellar biosynthesis protein FlhG
MYPEFNLSHVIDGQKHMSDILIRDYMGVDIVPGSTGISRLANLAVHQIGPVLESISVLDSYDMILFDTSAGADGNVTAFCRAASQVLLIITPEPTSLTDAYSLLKILSSQGGVKPVGVVVNQVRNQHHAQVAYLSLSRAAAQHLGLSLSLIGFIIQDPLVTEAVKRQRPFSALYPKSIASACIRNITDRFISEEGTGIFPTDMQSFWRTFMELPQESLPLPVPGHSPPPASVPADGSPAAGERDIREIKMHLSVIETQISAIVKVMTSLEERLRAHEGASPPPVANGSRRESIPLDFEAFLAEKPPMLPLQKQKPSHTDGSTTAAAQRGGRRVSDGNRDTV